MTQANGAMRDQGNYLSEVLIEKAEYLRCELELAARREMVVKLEDFLRRRSKIWYVVRRQDILAAQGLREACRLLFGPRADEKLLECFPELNGSELPFSSG